MTCSLVETWLLGARSVSELPEPVRAHLGACPGCARRLESLIQTDTAARELAPGANDAARRRLAETILHTPQTVPTPGAEPRLVKSPPRARRVPAWAVAVAASLLLVVGWAVGRMTSPKTVVQAPAPAPGTPAPPVVPQPKPPPTPAPNPAPVAGLPVAPFPSLTAGPMARAVRCAGHVAADASPLSQADALDRFAAEVRAGAIDRAFAGDAEALARLAGLHDRLLKLGVARQVARVPEGQRGEASARIAAGLDLAGERIATTSATLPPAVADLLHVVFASCRDTAVAIREAKLPAAPPDWPSPPTPLEAVAAQTLRLADTEDPLVRANESVRLATVMAQLATVLSAAGQDDDAGRVGETMATVLDSGVAANLDRVETGDPAGKRREEVKGVRDRAGLATEVLERNLAKAPPAARAGLERALLASAPGHEKATGKPARTPGPPRKGDDHPGKGKGWQKKP
jgi:hypothetical protein